MTIALEPGPYWVLRDGLWQVARWNGKRFWLWGCPDPFLPSDFDEIDRRRIERA